MIDANMMDDVVQPRVDVSLSDEGGLRWEVMSGRTDILPSWKESTRMFHFFFVIDENSIGKIQFKTELRNNSDGQVYEVWPRRTWGNVGGRNGPMGRRIYRRQVTSCVMKSVVAAVVVV